MSKETLTAFLSAASSYCSFIERAETLGARALVDEALHVLPVLYSAGAALPDVEPATDQDIDHGAHRDSSFTQGRGIAAKLADFDLYWEVFDPYEQEEPVRSSIGNDLAEIYADLKPSLSFFGKGNPQLDQDVAWDWRFGFTSHWGRHLLGALRALHQIQSEYLMLDAADPTELRVSRPGNNA